MPWVRCILLHKNKPHIMQDNLEWNRQRTIWDDRIGVKYLFGSFMKKGYTSLHRSKEICILNTRL